MALSKLSGDEQGIVSASCGNVFGPRVGRGR
jgi:hypothetical protein